MRKNWNVLLRLCPEILMISMLGRNPCLAIKLYGRNAHRIYIGDIVEYLHRCEKSYGGQVKIFLKPLNKRPNDFSRPLPLTHFGVNSFSWA